MLDRYGNTEHAPAEAVGGVHLRSPPEGICSAGLGASDAQQERTRPMASAEMKQTARAGRAGLVFKAEKRCFLGRCAWI